MSLPPWLNVSTGLVFTGVSLLIGLLGVAWEMGSIANGMNRAADNAATLSGQLRTITDSIDVEGASSVPDDVERMTAGMERVTEDVERVTDDIEQVSRDVERMTAGVERVTEDVGRIARAVDSLESVDDSVDNIEAAVTAVDLKGIEQAVERLLADSFGDGSLPVGNSVRYTLRESGVDVVISLVAVGDEATRVNVRFDEEVRSGAISDLLADDEDLARVEADLFDGRSSTSVPSPRQINFTVPTSNVDAVTQWVPATVGRLDEYILETSASAAEFDERVAEALEDDGS